MKVKHIYILPLELFVCFVSFIILLTARLLPRRVLRGLAPVVSFLAYQLFSSKRKAASENISYIFSSKNNISGRVKYCFDFFSRCFSDTVYFMAHSMERLLDYVEIEGLEYLQEAYDRNNGVIILTAHLGNFMLFPSVISLLGFSNKAIMRQLEWPVLDKFYSYARRLLKQYWIEKNPTIKSVKQSLSWLKEGNILIMHIDQRSSKGIEAPFLGYKSFAVTGPTVMALRSDAEILPSFLILSSDYRYRLIIGPPVEVPFTGNYKKDLTDITVKFSEIVSDYIFDYSYQWFWFHRKWRK